MNASYWISNYRIIMENNAEDINERLAKIIYWGHEKEIIKWEDLDSTGMSRRGTIECRDKYFYIFLLYYANQNSALKPCFQVTINSGLNDIPDKRTAFFLGDKAWAVIIRLFVDKINFKTLEDKGCGGDCKAY